MTTQTKQGQQWTPEPWTVDGWDLWHRGKDYNDPDDQHIFTGITTHKGCLTPTAKACLDRAAACVNACAGMTDPQAEIARLTHSDPVGLIASLQKQVEQLREACQAIVACSSYWANAFSGERRALELARKALEQTKP